ncbi:MAG: LCP family protein [Defluviitaleaceae bacterium]|nr:LCP family protein [Defluviitaleaceae bacterium]
MLKTRKQQKLFTISFAITCIATLLISGIAYISWNNIVRPPDIPIRVEASISHQDRVENNPTQNTESLPTSEDDNTEYEPEPPAPTVRQPEERKPLFYTFLIVGLTEGYNANTIMVASYDGNAGQGHVISIPRDTQVDFQRNNRKIVAAYNIGRANGRGHAGGVERLKMEVESIVGFWPDFYITIDYEAFTRIVDSVGGVEIYVPFHKLYDDPWQNLHINIPPGLQLLDGENALHFARYRRGNDRRQSITDYQRIENQQQVISAMMQNLLTPASIRRIPEFIRIFNDHFASDLAYGELTWFANHVRRSGGTDALEFHTLPMRGTSGAPSWYEWADEAGILELVNRTVNPFVRDITASDIRIVP